MRRKLVFGIGLAGVISGSAIAQFASDRVSPPATAPAAVPPSPAPATPVLPPGYQPVVPTTPAPVGGVPPAYIPPAGGVVPAGSATLPPLAEPRSFVPPPNVEIRTAIPPDHPWLIRPEHGAYFICVKSYSRPSRPTDDDRGPSALALAEALAGEIRDLYRVQAFLFEHISEERKAEAAAIAAARAQAQQLRNQWDKLRQQSQLRGMEFLEPDTKVRFKTVNYKDQIAVLVGGFKSDEDARKALDKVRAWPEPKTRVDGRSLMDWGTMTRLGPDGKPMQERDYINPYPTATVVPNPTTPRGQTAAGGLDPFIVELNEGQPYNLLKATKSWTLAVKSFAAPVELVGRNGGNGSVMRKPWMSKWSAALEASAEQAESLAKALREMKGPRGPDGRPGHSLGLEAFVLHTRHASLVTVGQFDGPNDPELLQKKRLLESMKMNVTEDKMGVKPVANAPSLFETVMPIPIPRP
jgi:hypothetical protein